MLLRLCTFFKTILRRLLLRNHDSKILKLLWELSHCLKRTCLTMKWQVIVNMFTPQYIRNKQLNQNNFPDMFDYLSFVCLRSNLGMRRIDDSLKTSISHYSNLPESASEKKSNVRLSSTLLPGTTVFLKPTFKIGQAVRAVCFLKPRVSCTRSSGSRSAAAFLSLDCWLLWPAARRAWGR